MKKLYAKYAARLACPGLTERERMSLMRRIEAIKNLNLGMPPQ